MSTAIAYPARGLSPLGLAWRSLAAGLGYLLFTILGGVADQALGLPVPDIANRLDPAQVLLGVVAGGIVMGLTLGPLSTRLSLPGVERAAVLFVLIYFLNTFLSVVEALFFTTFVTVDQLYSPSAVGAQLLTAALLAWLFRPAVVDQRLLPALRATLTRRRWFDWAWRFLVAGLLYVPIYLFFGSLIAPIVTPYYTHVDLGWNLVVPGFDVILPLEAFRGLVFVLAVFPLVAVLRGSRWSLAFWIGLTIAALGAWAPMLGATFFPPTLRVVHALEITADAFVQGIAIAWLLGMGEARREAVSGPGEAIEQPLGGLG